MMVQMNILQTIGGGLPGYVSLIVGVVLYKIVVGLGIRSASPTDQAADSLARAVVAVHFTTLALLMATFSPGSHSSTGVHQLPGECYVEATDITGLKRHEFLCVTDYEEDFTFECAAPPEPGSEWYTVCGRPHTNFAAWMGGLLLLAVIGIGNFWMIFGPIRRRSA